MDVGVVSFIIFVLILISLVYLKRKKLEISPLVVMFKTKKFRKAIISIAERHPRFWRSYFNLGVVVSFLLMIFGINFIVNNALAIFSGIKSSGLALVIPYPTETISVQVGLVKVPPWLWVLAIPFLIIPHELSHGISLALNKLKIKSLGGLLLFFIIPGAFVEPDENQLKKARKLQKLQVYAAGSFSNILTALVFILIFHILLFSLYEPNGIYYSFPGAEINKSAILEMKNLSTGFIELKTEKGNYLATENLLKIQENRSRILVYEDWPAIRANLSGTLKSIDGKSIYISKDLSQVLSEHKPGDTILIETSKDFYNITLSENNGKAYLGVVTNYDFISATKDYLSIITSHNFISATKDYLSIITNYKVLSATLSPLSIREYKIKFEELKGMGDFILQLVGFIIVICIGVGIFNMLPIKPLDGGFIVETLAGRKFANIISVIFVFIVIYNLVGPYI